MPNKRFEKFKGGGSPATPRGKHADKMPMRTANWPGTPGKHQPRDRSAGTPRVKAHPKSEGI